MKYSPKSGYKYVIPFGKHKGETIKQVLETDPGYIVWLNSLGKGLVMMPRPRRDIVILAEEADQENSRDELSWFDPDTLCGD
jgi:hypothetical protein